MTSRRGFLSAILAGVTAPAIVSATSLMKLTPTESGILTYKMSGRYDLNYDNIERMMRNIRADMESGLGPISMRPTHLIVPAWMRNQLTSGLLVATSK